MDLEKFYGMAPKPQASNSSLFNPADAKVIEVEHTDFHSDIMLTTSDNGPVSLMTPELKVRKKMAVENFDAMIEQIFDMV